MNVYTVDWDKVTVCWLFIESVLEKLYICVHNHPVFSVHDYMRLFGQVAEPNPSELLRHSVHQMHLMSSMESHFSDHDHEQEFIQSHSLRIINVYVFLLPYYLFCRL